MRHTSDILLEKGDRLEPKLVDTGDNHTAMLFIGEIGNDITLKFRSREALLKLIAVLITVDREWNDMDNVEEEFASEKIDLPEVLRG